jgi:SNF2 family DNA or RNA helicase
VDLSILPHDYREFEKLPDGIEVSSFIHAPVLFIDQGRDQIIVKFGVNVGRGDKQRKIYSPSKDHNWVLDENVIRPLPFDISRNFNDLVGKEIISYAEMLDLQKTEVFEVVLDENILTHANKQAEECFLDQNISDLNARLYPYQENGVAWMRKTLSAMQGCLLADEMGLGKTLQLIALMLLEPPTNDEPALIVCPTSLLANWSREIEKFAPKLTYLIHRGSDRTGIRSGLMIAQVVISTYETIIRDIRIFGSINWMYLVCDEAQALKNPDSERRCALSSLPRKYSLPVTGTPVENSLLDLWSLSDFAVQGILGDRESFESEYPDDEESASQLALVTDPFILKRSVSIVADQLPGRLDIDLPIELSNELALRYEHIRDEVKKKYAAAAGLVAVGQLSLFCAHPWLQSNEFESEYWEDGSFIKESDSIPLITPKIEVTLNLLREAIIQNKKVLIFAVFNNCYELLRRAAKGLIGREVYWNAINGNTSAFERQKIVDEFSDYNGPSVLVLNPKAAGAGLNITSATIVIHYTLNWNPAHEMQASARAYRIGQKQKVTVYRLFYEDTVERVMLDRVAWKRELADKALLPSNRDPEDINDALSSSPRNA